MTTTPKFDAICGKCNNPGKRTRGTKYYCPTCRTSWDTAAPVGDDGNKKKYWQTRLPKLGTLARRQVAIQIATKHATVGAHGGPTCKNCMSGRACPAAKSKRYLNRCAEVQGYGEVVTLCHTSPSPVELPSPKAPTKTPLGWTHTILVMDYSASMNMYHREADMIRTSCLEGAVEAAKKYPHVTQVFTEVAFDAPGNRRLPLCRASPVEEAKRLMDAFSYTPNGSSTALNDAVLFAIELARATPVPVDRVGNAATCIFICTDGMDNASFALAPAVAQAVSETHKRGDTTIVMGAIGAPQLKLWATSVGIEAGNMKYVEAAQAQSLASALPASTASYHASRACGQTASKKFFVGVPDEFDPVAAGLMDFTRHFSIWKSKKCDIQELVESHGFKYVRGFAYYQFSKDEREIQDYKDILILDRIARRVWASPAWTHPNGLHPDPCNRIRELVGLPPQGTGCSAAPSLTNARYAVMVQSKSLNRSLVDGTEVIYYNPKV